MIVKGIPPWKDERTPNFQPPMASSTNSRRVTKDRLSLTDGQRVDGGDGQAVAYIVGAPAIVRGYVMSILRVQPIRLVRKAASAEAGNSGFGVQRLGPGIGRDQVEIALPDVRL